MMLNLRRGEVGQRFGTYWVLEDATGHVVARSADEPFGFSTGARALTIWAEEHGYEILGGGVGGEPTWP
jgi:hypothetical protein